MTLVIFSFVSIAEISIGADISFYNSTSNSEAGNSSGITTESQTTQNTTSISPVIGIFPLKFIEIAPFFRWGISASSSESKTTGTTLNSTQKSERSQHTIEPGCGAYFHVIKDNSILDFSLGPKLSYAWALKPHSKNESGTSTSTTTEYDKYYNGSFNLGVQTNIDLKFTEHFKTRFYSNLFRLSFSNTHTKYKNTTVENRTVNILSDFRTILQPAFGFHFTF
jgi:hypothetical protein